jgi:hypothetical protein
MFKFSRPAELGQSLLGQSSFIIILLAVAVAEDRVAGEQPQQIEGEVVVVVQAGSRLRTRLQMRLEVLKPLRWGAVEAAAQTLATIPTEQREQTGAKPLLVPALRQRAGLLAGAGQTRQAVRVEAQLQTKGKFMEILALGLGEAAQAEQAVVAVLVRVRRQIWVEQAEEGVEIVFQTQIVQEAKAEAGEELDNPAMP